MGKIIRIKQELSGIRIERKIAVFPDQNHITFLFALLVIIFSGTITVFPRITDYLNNGKTDLPEVLFLTLPFTLLAVFFSFLYLRILIATEIILIADNYLHLSQNGILSGKINSFVISNIEDMKIETDESKNVIPFYKGSISFLFPDTGTEKKERIYFVFNASKEEASEIFRTIFPYCRYCISKDAVKDITEQN